jgi:hypothetical protein
MPLQFEGAITVPGAAELVVVWMDVDGHGPLRRRDDGGLAVSGNLPELGLGGRCSATGLMHRQ